jgi:NDP-sugar pyrophosphorylase family protein
MSAGAGPPQVVILAGGRGTRLAPYSNVLPKPLMPVGDQPILELLLRRLRSHGVEEVVLAVNHLASLIMAFFGDGDRLGLRIRYAIEDIPLGTAGPLGIIEGLTAPFILANGDILTDLDFTALMARHRAAGAAATIGLVEQESRLDYGVVQLDERGAVRSYLEKPSTRHNVSMGVYALDPSVLRHVQPQQRLDIPDLIQRLIAAGSPVTGYCHRGLWLDIGQPDQYRQAQQLIGVPG